MTTLPKKTIKAYAIELITKTIFVDCYGRNVGLDYATVLASIRSEFPRGRTTMRALRRIIDGLDRSTIRLPVRRRSRKILAEEYIKSLLLRPVCYKHIYHTVKDVFADAPVEVRTLHHIRHLERQLVRDGFKVPDRD